MSVIWTSQNFPSVDWLKRRVEQSLKDQFLQRWHMNLRDLSSCDLYRQYKVKFELEQYLFQLDVKSKRAVCLFRTNNTRLPIVTGRYSNTPRHERRCVLCDANQIGDEYHLLIECTHPVIASNRKKFIPHYVLSRPSVYKCIRWLQSTSAKDMTYLGKFLKNTLYLF